MKSTLIDRPRRTTALIAFVVIYIGLALYLSFSGGGYYTYDSPQKLRDLIEVRIWIIVSLIMALVIAFVVPERNRRLWAWIINLSVYFVVLYALFYKGTDYGFYGHWGDNGNRLALVTKFREFSSIFQDWYFKDLPSFYPPLWFYLSGKLAWLFDIESYKTIKIGYFFVYGLYPIGLFYVWHRLTEPKTAFLIAFLTLFLRDYQLDWVYYEHVTAAFFIPWWLYYIEDIKDVKNKTGRHYLVGGILGAIMFMTFYYWFFVGLAAVLARLPLRLTGVKKAGLPLRRIRSGLTILILVALFSSIYWMPLLISLFRYGADSMQNKWFSAGYLFFSIPFFALSLNGLIYFLGILYLPARFKRKTAHGLAFLFLGMLMLLLVERILNLNELSIQTRKLWELMPVFLAVPSAFALVFAYRLLVRNSPAFKKVLLMAAVAAVFFLGNEHVQITEDERYRTGIDMRPPEWALDVFRAIDYRGKVFLTGNYLEASYLPYYFFACHWSASAHPAARNNQRLAFLQYLSTLEDEARVAYLFRKNIFDEVDYFYIRVDEKRQVAYYDTRTLAFPNENVDLRIEFPCRYTTDSRYFHRKHERHFYEIQLPSRPVAEIFEPRPFVPTLQNLIDEYNRLNLACLYLPDKIADSLEPDRAAARSVLADSLNLSTLGELGGGLELCHLELIPTGHSRFLMRLLLRPTERILDDYGVMIHAYPDEDDDGRTVVPEIGFRNLDIHPRPPTTSWISGFCLLIRNEIELAPGRYIFHIGLFERGGERLGGVYKSPPIEIFPDLSRPQSPP